MKAEPSYRGPGSAPEPEPVYSRETADYREAGGQQGLAYTPEAVYASTEAPGHYLEGKAPARPGAERGARRTYAHTCLCPRGDHLRRVRERPGDHGRRPVRLPGW